MVCSPSIFEAFYLQRAVLRHGLSFACGASRSAHSSWGGVWFFSSILRTQHGSFYMVFHHGVWVVARGIPGTYQTEELWKFELTENLESKQQPWSSNFEFWIETTTRGHPKGYSAHSPDFFTWSLTMVCLLSPIEVETGKQTQQGIGSCRTVSEGWQWALCFAGVSLSLWRKSV